MPANDLYLVAVWEYDVYVVEWYSEGELHETQEYAYGASVQAPEYPIKTGYIFAAGRKKKAPILLLISEA